MAWMETERQAMVQTLHGTDPRLVDRFAAGGRGISPMRWGGDAVNLLEFVVHHEDIRRGAGEPAPRELPPGELAGMRRSWRSMPRAGAQRRPR